MVRLSSHPVCRTPRVTYRRKVQQLQRFGQVG